MKYVIAPRNLSLKVSQNILDEMYSKAFASFPNETGGMFAGRISEDSHEAIVERLVMPSKTESTHASFLRETGGMEQTWKNLQRKDLPIWENGIHIRKEQHNIAMLIVKQCCV